MQWPGSSRLVHPVPDEVAVVVMPSTGKSSYYHPLEHGQQAGGSLEEEVAELREENSRLRRCQEALALEVRALCRKAVPS